MSRSEVWYALVIQYIITMVYNLRSAMLGQAQLLYTSLDSVPERLQT